MLDKILENQKQLFRSGYTRPLDKRIGHLKKLKDIILRNDDRILEAIKKDLGRPYTETYTSEIFISIKEIDLAIKNLKKWAKPIKAKTPLLLMPGKSYIKYEPYGSALILGSWNYPFQLLMSPLVGAIAAGNCAVIKPSEISNNTSELIAEMINSIFDKNYIHCVNGGVKTAEKLLALDFDYIFFTGSTDIGKKVMKAASDKLIPLTLELGGKCPCIVDSSIDIEKTARRITWGKFFNLGQNCIAPDYVYAHNSIKSKLIAQIKKHIKKFYGSDPSKSPDYGRIIDERHFDRIISLLGKNHLKNLNVDRKDLYIEPSVIDAGWNDNLMEEEIFGPILPVLGYDNLKDTANNINMAAKPLQIYLFSNNKNNIKYISHNTSSGGITVNDVLIQAVSNFIPFGGVGLSGIGRYRGKYSFEAFSNQKSIVKRGFFLDWKFRYPPYELGIKKLKKIFRFF